MYTRFFCLFSLLLVTPITLSAKSTTETPPGLQAAYQQARHQIEVIEEKGKPTRWRAVNANNHLSVDFNGKGIKARSTKDDWNLIMELNKIGAPEKLQSVNKPNVTVKDNRLTYDRGNIQEWYINDPRGLEQGFTLNKPLAKERLVLQFALGGDVKPRLIDRGKGLQLITPKGKKLRYEGLKAWDAKGKDLKATMSLKGHSMQLEVAVTDAAYPITIDPWLVEEDKLTASDSTEGVSFGSSVAIFGDTAVVGAPAAAFSSLDGAAYIFTRDGTGTWSQQAKLAASDPAVNDRFGFSVGISGNTAVVGTITRLVYVFTRSGATWSQQAKLTSPAATSSVAISGDTAVVGVMWDYDGESNGTGFAYVFTRDGTGIWSQQAELAASDGALNDGFGSSVAISGNTAVVGASNDDGASGSAYVFTRSGISWSQQTKLTASRRGYALFGDSIAISGNTVVVGAFAEAHEEVHVSKGSAYVFTRDARAIWSQQARLTASDAIRDDEFGTSVAISDDIAVVGAPNVNDWGEMSGSAYVFTRNGTTWSQQAKLTASDVVKHDSFGRSVAISGDTAMAGKAGRAGLGGGDEGSAYVFNLSCEATYLLPNNQWRQISLPCNPGVNNKVGDVFGDDDLGTYDTDWILYRFDTALDDYVPLAITDTLRQGAGYWIMQVSGSNKMLGMPQGSLPTPVDVSASATTCASTKGCFEIPLATQNDSAVQWNMIGHVFADTGNQGHARVLTELATTPNDCSDSDGCTLTEAEASHIVDNELWTYNGADYTKIITSGGNLDPWAGYWSVTLDSADGTTPKLLMPKP